MAVAELDPVDAWVGSRLAEHNRHIVAEPVTFFDFGNAIWGHLFVTLHGFLDAVEEWTLGAAATGRPRRAVQRIPRRLV